MTELNLPKYDAPKISLTDDYIDNYLKVNINPKTLLLHLSRSCNYNVLCYEVLVDNNGDIDPDNIVGNYWLDIDPALIKKNRKKGIMTDRTETNIMENKLAFGVKSTINSESGSIDVNIKALKNHTFQLVQNEGNYTLQGIYQGKCCKLLKAHAEVTYNLMVCKVKEVYLWWKPVTGGDVMVEKLT